MNPRIKTAKANDDYSFTLIFQNGDEGKFDLKPYLDIGKFKELKDLNNFKRFKLDDGVITWFNGLDISPDTVFLSKY
jgi:hypothetical protein